MTASLAKQSEEEDGGRARKAVDGAGQRDTWVMGVEATGMSVSASLAKEREVGCCSRCTDRRVRPNCHRIASGWVDRTAAAVGAGRETCLASLA